MTLDINTGKGRIAAALQNECIAILQEKLPALRFYSTGDDNAAHLDGIICKAERLVGVYELKARTGTLEKFMDEFKSEWILSMSKVKALSLVSASLHVPGYGILFLHEDGNLILTVKITDEHGNHTKAVLRSETTRTQATVNGGSVVRENAFINLNDATVYNT